MAAASVFRLPVQGRFLCVPNAAAILLLTQMSTQVLLLNLES